ncbi:MAG: acyl-CoA thioesterase, partial [Deltaproteobacteria bacterium]|nr:acyl-CoA thioesterase [Deltaproteobacteria bacterium]
MLVHKTEVQVRFGDTDPYGVVYFVAYFRYFHQGIEEFLRHIGINPGTFFRNKEE